MALTEGVFMLLSRAVEVFLLDRRISGCSEATIKHYDYTSNVFKGFLGSDIELGSSAQQLVLDFFLQLREHNTLSDATIYGYRRDLSAFFNFLDSEHFIEEKIRMPRMSKPKTRKKALTAEEIQKCIKACKDPNADRFTCIRNRAMLLWFYDTGCRLSETANLQISDLNWETRLARVVGKGNKERFVPFGLKTKKELWTYLKRRESYKNYSPSISDYFWINREGFPLTRKFELRAVSN
jgi:site-specific recombinase XerD